MKAIETLYNGNYFRSRLEAKWAYFFDWAEIKYVYEPEGFASDDGKHKYLPDFFLPKTYQRGYNKGVYIEIKPEIHEIEYDKYKWFDKPLNLFKGMPDLHIWGVWDDPNYFSKECGGTEIGMSYDNPMHIWKCKECGASKIEFAEGNYDWCPECEKGTYDWFLLKEAAIQTIQKRFEHQ
jgi:hypothetical protein